MHFDVHELISFKAGMLIDTTKFYVFISSLSDLNLQLRPQGSKK